jgi:hypothetical protein
MSRTSTVESPILRPDPMGGAGIGLLGGMYRPPPDVRNGSGYNVPNPPIRGPTGTLPLSDWNTATSAPAETPTPALATSRQQPSFSAGHEDKGDYMPPMVMAGQKRKHAETRNSASEDSQQDRWPKDRLPPLAPSTLAAEHSDIIDRGILTMERASQLFARYNDHMVQHLPAVVFPPGVTAAEIRKNKPILFLSIMSASSSEDPVTQRTLVRELMQIFADKVIVTGEKTLELVQALQVAVIWYWPPEHFEELKFYQLVHIGVVMGIDIGLGRKKQSSRLRRHLPSTWRDHPFKKHPPPDPMSIEARRAWLVCYFLSSNTAMALHRPILLRWTIFMTESVDVLESSPDAAPTDKYLCHLVWTHRLAEEIGMSFSMDDPGANINIADARTQHALKGFEHQLDKYRRTIPPELLQRRSLSIFPPHAAQYSLSSSSHLTDSAAATLAMSIHVLNLYMHEIALHTEKSEGMGLRDVTVNIDAVLTPAHISALSACLNAIDGMFEAFLGMEVSAIRCLPVFNFVRVAYAVVILIKMYFAACSPKSEFGKVINKDHMKVDQHLENLLEKFRSTAADDKSRPAAKFLVILVMLRSWFQRQSKSGGNFKPHCRDGAKQGEDGAAEGTNANATSTNNDNIDPALQSRSLQATPVAAGMQLPTPKEYSGSANTPLQLLSEVATNDGGSSTNGAATASMNVTNAGGLPAWVTPRANSQAQPFMYDGNIVDPNAAMDWPMTAFSTDDFSLDGMLGDSGFSDAVNLTLGGMGDGLNGGADGMGGPGANSGMRNLMQEQWFGE